MPCCMFSTVISCSKKHWSSTQRKTVPEKLKKTLFNTIKECIQRLFKLELQIEVEKITIEQKLISFVPILVSPVSF